MTDAAWLAAIVESSDDAIIGKDLKGVIRSWNRAAESIFGYSAAEIIGRPIQILFPPDRLAEEDDIVARIRRGERVEHHETVRRRRDGTDVPVSITISPIRGVDGAIVGASKILRDVSERRTALQALARSEAELRAAFEGSAVGKALAEPGTRQIVRVNDALAAMLAMEPASLIGRTLGEMIHPDDRAQAEAYAAVIGRSDQGPPRELRVVRPDGSVLWTRMSVALATAPPDRRPFLAVIEVEDIDARRRARLDLMEAKRDLEQVVGERTQALAERNLLLREVYHRVKNNLQVIDGMLMLVMHRTGDETARQGLSDLRSRVLALGLVHQQLMSSSDLNTFDIGPFLQQLTENLVGGSGAAGVSLHVDASPLSVGLDFAIPLGLIVTEIVTNALKHAFPGGSGAVRVALVADGPNVVLTISDDGQGMAAASPPATGSGIGAGLIRRLVAQMDGAMTVRQAAGVTYEIRVPRPEPA